MHFVEAKGILNNSGGSYGMNIYRGCTHGCIYCDSRSTCYHFLHAFEDVEVKQNAPELLEKALKSKRSKCMIGTGSMSDPYMHCEEKLRLTRRCLEIIRKYGAENLKSQLWNAYLEAREERGYAELDGSEVSPDELLTGADGCAIINEGLMFYYLPYHIGCGAEGEYNLVLPIK